MIKRKGGFTPPLVIFRYLCRGGREVNKKPLFLFWRACLSGRGAGFTLVEILVSIAILCLLMVGGAKFFSNTVKSWRNNISQIEIQQEARMTMDEMTKYIRQAPASSVVIYSTATPANSKIFFTNVRDTSTNYYNYYLSNQEIYRELNGVENKVADNVETLSFSWTNPDTGAPETRCVFVTLILGKEFQRVRLDGRVHLKNP